MISTGASGGAFYFNGVHVSLSIIGFSSAAKLNFNTATALATGASGGLVYSNNGLALTLTNVNIQGVTSQVNGGLLYIT